MKKVFARLTALLTAVFTMAIIASITATSAFAADEVVEVPNEAVAMVEEHHNENVVILQPMVNSYTEPMIMPLGNPAGGNGGNGGGGNSGSTTADTAYTNVINFFITWIRRLGAAVAFFGAVMFGLAFKKDDADGKENGIKTMIAGFLVWAVCGVVALFDLFG